MSVDRSDVAAESGAPEGHPRAWARSLVADVAVVVVFALAGRVFHERGSLLTGTLVTAAPFLLGLLAGWLRAPCAGMPEARRAPTVRFGAWLLGTTMLGGIGLRWVTGEGLAPAFVLVAFGVLAIGLVGRRWLAAAWRGRAR